MELSKSGEKTPVNTQTTSLTTFKVLTFNTWGLKYISKERKTRLHGIADRLASNSTDYDIVALQEVWVAEDWEYFKDVCKAKYPFHRIFYSGMVTGPGLAILSKFPIHSTYLYRYPVNGRPSAFFRGDWYVGKGASVTVIDPPAEGLPQLAIVNTHMHAPYAKTGDAAYKCHRVAQAWDLSNLVANIERRGYAVILVGDMNCRPGELSYRLLENEARLEDSWEVLHGPTDRRKIANMTPEDQLKYGATTCDSHLNSWRENWPIADASRLDYMLLGGGWLEPIDAGVAFTDRIPGVGSFSDHFGYTATFQVNAEPKPINVPACKLLHIYDEASNLIQDYLNTTNKSQRFWRYIHLWVSLILIVAFIPGIIFASNAESWSSVIFYVLGVLIGISGVIDGLIAFLFCQNEERALIEVIHQINDQRRYLTVHMDDKPIE